MAKREEGEQIVTKVCEVPTTEPDHRHNVEISSVLQCDFAFLHTYFIISGKCKVNIVKDIFKVGSLPVIQIDGDSVIIVLFDSAQQ